MKSLSRSLLLACLSGVLLTGCSGEDFSDLDAFMEEKRSRPGGIIAPIPTFKAYEAFAYSATTLRSIDNARKGYELGQRTAMPAY